MNDGKCNVTAVAFLLGECEYMCIYVYMCVCKCVHVYVCVNLCMFIVYVPVHVCVCSWKSEMVCGSRNVDLVCLWAVWKGC